MIMNIQDYFKKAKARKKKRKAKAKVLWNHGSKGVPRSELVKRLDAVFSLYIRMRDKKKHGHGQISGGPIECCYHLIPRTSFSIRWDVRNAIGESNACNFGERNHRLLYRQKHIDLIGQELYDDLERLSRTTVRYTNFELIEMRNKFKMMLEEL